MAESHGFLIGSDRPWERLPPGTLASLMPLLPEIANEIVETIAREVPEYRRPLTSEFGQRVSVAVEQALQQFARLIAQPDPRRRGTDRGPYMELGRGELQSGRSMESLLAGYRVGARVAWRRLAAGGIKAGVPQEDLNLLAESIFVYIDELSAESAEGYAQAQAERAGEVDRRRGNLIELLTRPEPVDPAMLAQAVESAHWQLPARLAVVLWKTESGRRPASLLPAGSIVTETGGLYCAIVPDPDGSDRRRELRAAFESTPAAMGTVVNPDGGNASLRHATTALTIAGERGRQTILFADEHLHDLLCRADPSLVDEITTRRLNVLSGETPQSSIRLRETLLAWLRHDGGIAQAAMSLHVHVQTVRYRLAKLRELFGEDLDDPDLRFELEVALRATANPQTQGH